MIRKKYWITRIRPVVKQVVRECVRCKRLYAPTCVQKMSDLPSSRLEPYSSPFTTSGVDCFGPFTVKRARSEVKRYGCLFVCFSTRAVHLELLDDLSTSSFMNALRRFVARRGHVRKIYSDNGTNFVGAKNALGRLDDEAVSKWAATQSIEWIFNPPHASHMGGVWERLIRTVRRVLL